MPDNLKIRQPEDRLKINIHEPYELRDWAKKFNVTEAQIRQAVQVVGPMVVDVKRHLGR